MDFPELNQLYDRGFFVVVLYAAILQINSHKKILFPKICAIQDQITLLLSQADLNLICESWLLICLVATINCKKNNVIVVITNASFFVNSQQIRHDQSKEPCLVNDIIEYRKKVAALNNNCLSNCLSPHTVT